MQPTPPLPASQEAKPAEPQAAAEEPKKVTPEVKTLDIGSRDSPGIRRDPSGDQAPCVRDHALWKKEGR
ncbi:MAG TPA: hypothetical protein VHP14_18290 [Anaerolineales bacterium]|nr:hypothetical protein [Anaerolineales bacterium]